MSYIDKTYKKIIENYPFRFYRNQKKRFRKSLIEQMKNTGYKVIEDKHILATNCYTDNLDSSSYLFIAHYDTTCDNWIFFITWALCIIYTFTAGKVLPLNIYRFVFCIMAFTVLFVYFCVPNIHNANDNTSGVLALLSIAYKLKNEDKGKVTFLFTDNEEYGLIGSKRFYKKYKKLLQNKVVVNFDCVGYDCHSEKKGKHIYLHCLEKGLHSKEQSEKLESLLTDNFKSLGVKAVLTNKIDRSDYKIFKNCYSYSLNIGNQVHLITIHTWKDTKIDLNFIDKISNSIIQFIK